MAQQQPQQAIHKFVLGNKELEGKTAEFQYDKGWYSITDIVGEERNVIPQCAGSLYEMERIYRPKKRETVIRKKQRCGSWKPCGWKQSKRFP